MKTVYHFAIILSALLLNGCAGLFIAGATTGVNVATDPRITQEIVKDNNIALEIVGLGNKAQFDKVLRVSANSDRGIVVLIGQATTQQLSDDFEKEVSKLNGVKKIHNQIRIKPPIGIAQSSQDSWITTRVKSSLLADTKLNGIKVKVITEDGEVFLMGYISRENADIAADLARNVPNVKQVIKAFQYLD